MWLPDDGCQPLKYVGVDSYYVYVFGCASCWFYKIKYITQHSKNNVKIRSWAGLTQ